MKKLVTNANVFDGTHEALIEHAHIVIEDDKVVEILQGDISTEQFDEVLDAGSKTVIPGLVDSHIHLNFSASMVILTTYRPDELYIRSARFAEEILMRGFTSVREAGGVVTGLKTCIDNGMAKGPRVFPSQGAISQTSGHSDGRIYRSEKVRPHHTNNWMEMGHFVLADGVPEVLRAVREQLFLGASQIKIMAGGGMSSQFDPLYTLQYTAEEMKAAVDAAADYGTYVMAHIYTNEAMQRAAKAGVKSFEHATLIDEETARIVQEKGIWLCPCPQFGGSGSKNPFIPFAKPFGTVALKAKPPADTMTNGMQKQAELINKYDLNLVFGTDVFRNEATVDDDDRQLTDLRNYKKFFGSFKGLKAATGNACELSKLTTYQNPYPGGKIGVLEPGSFADLLIVNGNPVEDLEVLCEPANIQLVMKGGTVFRDDR